MTQARSIQHLYSQEAALYSAFANDRDFSAEIDFVRSLLSDEIGKARPFRLLELFAGPAWHSRAWKNLSSSHRVLAIDASHSMKAIALAETGLKDEEYVVGVLPDVLLHGRDLGVFDAILALRFSLGYLAPPGFEALLRDCSQRLSPGGLMLCSLHDSARLARNLEDLDIRRRVRHLDNGETVAAFWPHGPLRWEEKCGKLVEMDVLVELTSTGGVQREHRFLSREYLYTLADVQAAIDEIEGVSVKVHGTDALQVFGETLLVSLHHDH